MTALPIDLDFLARCIKLGDDPRVILGQAHQAGVEAERARAAAGPIVLDEAAFIQRHLMESTGKSADYASAYQHDTLHGETHAEVARRAYEVASEMLVEVQS